MSEQVKIRQIEMDIYNVLKSGVENTLDVSIALNLTYSAVHSVLNRMIMYYIVERKGNGIYGPLEGDFIVASDSEVIAYRRKKKNQLSVCESTNELDVPEEVVDFVRHQYGSLVERNLILTRLKQNGVHMTKFMLNQIIYQNGIDKEFPEYNRASEEIMLML
ncbi:hypothetical protein [Paenibacillus sp. Y412MC10]|uniref:hypothetical protein n=1 Tax=Geobacillus sp. (strain Y412MC10) TaxID=481743 RepID=UPI0011AB8CF9|nr:hypothetical protein [Paenibacillus sp. Y412MC10]